MSENEKIVCKPTPWFLFRAAIMLLMFATPLFAGFANRSGCAVEGDGTHQTCDEPE